jgi:hypothetical protein
MVAKAVKFITLTERMFTKSTHHFVSWLDAVPYNSILCLQDEEFHTAINIRLGTLQPFPLPCSTQAASQQEFSHHVFTCQQCAQSQWWFRHQKVLLSIKRTLSFFGIFNRIPKDGELPIPGNTKGGADLIVSTSDLHFVDVKITAGTPDYAKYSWSCVKFNSTLSHYREFEKQTKLKVIPFVVSIFGTVEPRTLEAIAPWFEQSPNPKLFRVSLYLNLQFELMRTLHQSLTLLRCRQLDVAATPDAPAVVLSR